MAVSTVNISFRKDLLAKIDEAAREECRTRSELIREAARLYVERKERWDRIFKFGERQAARRGLTEADVGVEIGRIRAGRKK
ncbi:MAG: ribbon-helix-helix protein, CopG family [Candidatus Aminicenantes bacterium]|jgi:metal-responsive CopG/Arc/MetJ family transcriptional regulator|nr:ribbon-helix-helix protein, CopG family [Candidatus Aminicenantes bacterium]